MLFATLLVGVFVVALQPKTATAANPSTMSFQGKVVNSDGTNVANGTYAFVFKLYTVSSSGSAIWTETQSNVTVSSGVFHANLGSICPFFTSNTCNNSTPIDFNTNSSLYLGITFNSDPAGEMSPRVQLQSVPFAFNSDRVGGLTVDQLVQLSPSSQQTGTIDISGGVTSGGTVQGATLVATGALQGNSLSVNSGSFEVTSAGAVTGGTYNGATLSGTELTGDGALAITSGGSNQNLTVNASGSGQILVGGTSTGNILFGGGSGSTGCTLTNSTGAFACTSTINGATISGGTLSGTALTGTSAFSVTAGGSNQALNLNGSGSGAVNIGGTSTGSINMAGGYGSTGCTITTAGALSCNGSGTFDSTLQATDITATGDVVINGGDVTSSASTVNLFNTNTATNTLNIANATIATGQTGTVNIATSATGTGKNVVTIGSTVGASAVTLQAGSAGITLTGATTVSGSLDVSGVNTFTVGTGTATFGGTLAVNGGTITSSAATVNLFNGASPTAINLATSASATAITIGNTTGASSLALQAGSGGISLTGNSTVTGTLSATSFINSSTQLGAHNGSGGRVQLAAGGSGNTGFIQWYRSDNTTRIAYLGFNSGGANNLGMNLESGAAFQINGGNVGIGLGSTAPSAALQVNGTVAVGTSAALGVAGDLTVSRNSASTTGVVYFGSGGNYIYYNGTNFQMTSGLSIGSNLAVGSGASITNSLSVGANLQVGALAAAAGTHVCINGSNYLSSCSSSLAYKKDVTALTTADYEDVLSKIANTEIFTYRWKDGDNRINTGVISEYLPAELIQGLDSQNNPIPDWTSITGYLWAGSRELANQVNALHSMNTQQDAAMMIQSGKIDDLNTTSTALLSSVTSLTDNSTLLNGVIADMNAQIQVLQSSLGGQPDWADIATNDVLLRLDANGLTISPDGQRTTLGGDVDIAGDAAFGGAVRMDFKGSDGLNISRNSEGDGAGISFIATPANTDYDTSGLFIKQAAGNGSYGLDSGIRIDNANADAEIGAALQIDNSGGGGYRSLIGSSNFNVSGAGEVTANGGVTARNSLQILSSANQQLFTIDAAGNANLAGALDAATATLSGGLNVGGDANFAGLTTFQKLATFIGKTIFKQDVEFEGDITVAKDTAGYAKMRVGESSVHVSFTKPYTAIPIVNANVVSGQFAKTSINNTTVNGFDITLSEPAATETTLNWTAILVKDPHTATNPATP